MSLVYIDDEYLTEIADQVRRLSGTGVKYTPSAMIEQLNEVLSSKEWERSSDWPDYDSYCQRCGEDVLYLTCAPTSDNSTVTFTMTTTDSGTYLVEIGSVNENGFTLTGGSTSVASGSAFSEDLGTDSTYVVIRITATTGNLCNLYFSTSTNTIDTSPVIEIWGRAEGMTGKAYQFANSSLISIDIICPKAFSTAQSILHNAKSLEYANVRNWDMSAVTTLFRFAFNCAALQTLNVSGWDIGNVTTLYQFCREASNITSIDTSSWTNATKVTSLKEAFYKCTSLTYLDLSSIDASTVTDVSSIFYGCSSLSDFYPPSNIMISLDISASPNLTEDSINRIVAALYDYSNTTETYTLTIGSTNLAKMTDDEIAVATAKGWTIA